MSSGLRIPAGGGKCFWFLLSLLHQDPSPDNEGNFFTFFSFCTAVPRSELRTFRVLSYLWSKTNKLHIFLLLWNRCPFFFSCEPVGVPALMLISRLYVTALLLSIITSQPSTAPDIWQMAALAIITINQRGWEWIPSNPTDVWATLSSTAWSLPEEWDDKCTRDCLGSLFRTAVCVKDLWVALQSSSIPQRISQSLFHPQKHEAWATCEISGFVFSMGGVIVIFELQLYQFCLLAFHPSCLWPNSGSNQWWGQTSEVKEPELMVKLASGIRTCEMTEWL